VRKDHCGFAKLTTGLPYILALHQAKAVVDLPPFCTWARKLPPKTKQNMGFIHTRPATSPIVSRRLSFQKRGLFAHRTCAPSSSAGCTGCNVGCLQSCPANISPTATRRERPLLWLPSTEAHHSSDVEGPLRLSRAPRGENRRHPEGYGSRTQDLIGERVGSPKSLDPDKIALRQCRRGRTIVNLSDSVEKNKACERRKIDLDVKACPPH